MFFFLVKSGIIMLEKCGGSFRLEVFVRAYVVKYRLILN